MSTKTIYSLILMLSIIGIGLASYLLYQYYAPPHDSLCYINAKINCDASTKGELANTLGIPTAIYGLVGYIIILIASLKEWKKVIFGMASFGMLFCLRITFLEIFVIKAYCPVCILCQIIMLCIFILSITLLRKNSLPKTTT